MIEVILNICLSMLKKWGVLDKVNPFVIEWGMHYLKGSQTTKELPRELIHITKAHICLSLLNPNCFGWAICYPYKQKDLTWYTHPTMGVVGGFTYKLVSYEDKFIVECHDKWDFNNKNYVIPLPYEFLNSKMTSVLVNLITKFNIPVKQDWIETDCGELIEVWGIEEQWLTKYNEKHCFSTKWNVILPNKLKCDL